MKEKTKNNPARCKLWGMILTLAFLFVGHTALAQSVQVTGVVNDNLGPVIGATVIEKALPTVSPLIWTATSN